MLLFVRRLVLIAGVGSALLTPQVGCSEKDCKPGGCSGELCEDADDEPKSSACEYDPSFACYKSATCKQQPSGSCGWTRTAELESCIANSYPKEGSPCNYGKCAQGLVCASAVDPKTGSYSGGVCKSR